MSTTPETIVKVDCHLKLKCTCTSLFMVTSDDTHVRTYLSDGGSMRPLDGAVLLLVVVVVMAVAVVTVVVARLGWLHGGLRRLRDGQW